MRAVVLLSGGIDSSTTLAIAKRDAFEVHALTVEYRQRHAIEVESARLVAKRFSVPQTIIHIDLRIFGRSALTGSTDVPKDRTRDEMRTGIPPTYVPARNTIFLSHALALAEVIGASEIFIGANELDHGGYPDCRAEYLMAFETMANLATERGVSGERLRIHAPLIRMSKAAVITLGASLGVDFSETSSCYDPDTSGRACGRCDTCQLRRDGFAGAGLVDTKDFTL